MTGLTIANVIRIQAAVLASFGAFLSCEVWYLAAASVPPAWFMWGVGVVPAFLWVNAVLGVVQSGEQRKEVRS